MSKDFLAWRGCSIRAFQFDLLEQLLDLARVGLIFDAPGGPPNYAIQDRHFLVVLWPRAEASPDRELVLLAHGRFEPGD